MKMLGIACFVLPSGPTQVNLQAGRTRIKEVHPNQCWYWFQAILVGQGGSPDVTPRSRDLSFRNEHILSGSQTVTSNVSSPFWGDNYVLILQVVLRYALAESDLTLPDLVHLPHNSQMASL